jgi:hypothetical protein
MFWKKKKNEPSAETPAKLPEEFPDEDNDELEDDEDEDDDWEAEPDEEDRRIAAIFNRQSPPDVNQKTLATYLAHLRKHIELPCRVTGMEDFPWEERFFFGHGSKREHEEMKKTKPSSEDTFELLGFDDEYDDWDGIRAKVKRVTDQKQFVIGLQWLETVDRKSPNSQLLSDYSSWFVNHR